MSAKSSVKNTANITSCTQYVENTIKTSVHDQFTTTPNSLFGRYLMYGDMYCTTTNNNLQNQSERLRFQPEPQGAEELFVNLELRT